jgi:hypothetical protein
MRQARKLACRNPVLEVGRQVALLSVSLFVGCGGGGSEAPNTGSAASLMPVVDPTKIPAAAEGFSTERAGPTTEQAPSTSSGGDFRTWCDFSHMNFDDFVVFPRQPGVSHLHTYFGNTGANANSTSDSIASSGNSTCRGGILNRSGYWVPSLIDTRTGTPVTPKGAHVYYKTNGMVSANITAFPKGLRMIAGNAKATGPQDLQALGGFQCVERSELSGPQVQNCPVGTEMTAGINFPTCWDGVSLDSPDHKSHMAYTINNGSAWVCPADHPKVMPAIAIIAVYEITDANAYRYWRLSSDNYSASLPGGYSMHADWVNGWKLETMDTFVNHCLRASKDCDSHLLGDGRAIY